MRFFVIARSETTKQSRANARFSGIPADRNDQRGNLVIHANLLYFIAII